MNIDVKNLAAQAQQRIRQLGLPRRNNDLWTYFPVKQFPKSDFLDNNSSLDDITENWIKEETDIAALLPTANFAGISKKDFSEGASEMGIVKCNDDFGYSIFNIGKNAKISLEILDNKVCHSIVAERFDIHVAEGAEVEIFFANPDSKLPLKFRHFSINQGKNSTVRMSNIVQESGIGRISVDCNLDGEGARFEYKSMSLLNGNASQHSRITINHNAPNTTSEQFVKNMLDGASYVSYDGKVVAKKDCPEVHSSQLVNSIMLSNETTVSVKPALKIYHDNVECSHGNTVGELDAEQLFYLESRGIPSKVATDMLIKSFARELFANLPDSPAKSRLQQVLNNAL